MALNKKQRKAVKKAGKNISKKESKQLKKLGISQNQVRIQAQRNNQSIRGVKIGVQAAKKNNAKKSTPAPKPKPAGPNKQVKAVRQATSDGRVTKKEASNLRDLGVKKSVTNQLRDQSKLNTSIGGVNVGGKLEKGEAKALRDLGFNDAEILASATAKNINVGGTTRKILDGTKAQKDLAKQFNRNVKFGGMSLKDYQAQFKPTEEPVGRPGAQYTTQTRQPAKDPKKNLLAALYEDNPYITESEIFRAAAGAGIKNVDSANDIRAIKQFMAAGNGGVVFQNGGGGRYNGSGADRTSGDFDDIISALQEDIQAGKDQAAALDDMAVPSGGNGGGGNGGGGGGNGGKSPIQEITDLLSVVTGGGNSGGGGNNQTPTGQLEDLTDTGASPSEALDLIGQGLQTQIDDINAGLNSIPNTLNDLLDLQKDENKATNAAMLASLQSANTAFADQQRIAGNISRAYVPGANPSAALPAIGDQRASDRDVKNNRLSDLTVLSGVGKQRNPLVGLQLS